MAKLHFLIDPMNSENQKKNIGAKYENTALERRTDMYDDNTLRSEG